MTFKKKQEPIREHDAVRRSVCGHCPAGCGLKVFLRQGRVVDIFGDEEHPVNKGSLCPKGMLAYDHLRNPARLTVPQIRENLSDPFRSVTWEEALAFAAERLFRAADRFGKDSVTIFGRETDPFDYLAGGAWFAAHFGTGSLPSQHFAPSFGTSGALKRMFGLPGEQLLMNSPRDWRHSRSILIYRGDLAASDPMTFGPLLDARDRGAALLAIDDRRTMTLSRAGEALRIKPGSGAVVLKALVRLLLESDWIDRTFLSEWTSGLEHLEASVRDYTPEAAAREAWIDVEDLKLAAATIGRQRPLQVITGNWSSRHRLSDEELCLCGALVCLTGSAGIPGGGLNLLASSPFSWPNLVKGRKPEGGAPRDYEHPVNPGGWLNGAEPDPAVLIGYGHPLASLPGGLRAWDRLSGLSLMIHLGFYPNAAYHRAHVFFPLSSSLEYEGLTAVSNGRCLQWRNQAAAPPEGCRTPLDFWTGLAQACRLGGEWPWRKPDGGADQRAAADFFLKSNPLTQAASVELLDPEFNPPGGLLWPCTEEKDLAFENSRYITGNVRGRNILFQHRSNFPLSDRRFPTTDGRVAFQQFGRLPESGEDADRPLLLIAGVLVDYIRDFGYFVTDRRGRGASPTIKIHPLIGRLLGVKTGENVTVESSLGSLTAPVWLTDEIDPRVVWCPEGLDPHQPHFTGLPVETLFAAPDRPARVAVYRPEADKAAVSREIARLLKGLEPPSGTVAPKKTDRKQGQ